MSIRPLGNSVFYQTAFNLTLLLITTNTMSYYFTIIGTRDNPLFEHEFGTSKAGGDGIARFRDEARHMNQFIVHSSLDIVEEVQWGNNGLCVISHTSFPVTPLTLIEKLSQER